MIKKTEKQAVPGSPKDEGSVAKLAALIVLAAFALFLVYYLFPQDAFVPGTPVNQSKFIDIFSSATRVYVVMDVRGITDPVVAKNVLQCGVDFSGSSGMGGKNATFFSLSDNCAAPDGVHPLLNCTSQLKDGITLYVKGGSGAPAFYSNGMVVSVGTNYTLGTCGIKRV